MRQFVLYILSSQKHAFNEIDWCPIWLFVVQDNFNFSTSSTNLSEQLHVHDDVGNRVPKWNGSTVDNLGIPGIHVLTEALEEPLVTLNFTLVSVLDAEMNRHWNVEEFLLLHSPRLFIPEHEIVDEILVNQKIVLLLLRQSCKKLGESDHL